MVRVLGIVGLVGASLGSIGWSLANLPEPTTTLAYAETSGADRAAPGGDGAFTGSGGVGGQLAMDDGTDRASGPLDILAEAGYQPALEPVGPALATGIYRVADAETPATSGSRGRHRVRRDRDITPRVDPYDTGALMIESGIAPVQPIVVRGEIRPGLYATSFDAAGCSYELTRVMRDRALAVIGEEYLSAGRVLVHLNEIEPDWFVSTAGCGGWYAWTPLPVALTEAGNGDYWRGDLSRGVWRVPDGCRWERVVSFRGGALHDVVGWGAAPTPLVVDDETYGVRIRGCRRPLTFDPTATAEREAELAAEAARADDDDDDDDRGVDGRGDDDDDDRGVDDRGGGDDDGRGGDGRGGATGRGTDRVGRD